MAGGERGIVIPFEKLLVIERMTRKRDPFDPLDRFLRELMNNMSQASGHPAASPLQNSKAVDESNFTVTETDDGYMVVADLPGFEKENLDLLFEDGVLTIRGQRNVQTQVGDQMRQIHKQVPVSEYVIEDEIEAEYRNGVLEVTLPVESGDDDESGHQIDIQ